MTPSQQAAMQRALETLEDAAESLGRFCGDEGWGQVDMDRMDNADACVHYLRAALAEPEPVAHRHEWIRTGAMKPNEMRCLQCGAWGETIDAAMAEKADVPETDFGNMAAAVAEPVASVTECEACFTPDVCQLRGTCDHYAAERLRVAAPPQREPVHQWRKRLCAEWYDGHPDHDDGGGPYETRTLYAAPPRRKPLTDEEIERVRQDAQRYRWLAARLLAADFDYGGEGVQTLVFEMPNGCAVSADCNATIDAAMAEKADVPETNFGNMAVAAAVAAERERCAQVCRARAEKMHDEAERLRLTEPDEISSLLAMAWQLTVAAQEISSPKEAT